MLNENENRVAIVTGGTRGIGLAIVKRFVADGYKVVATGSTKRSIEEAELSFNRGERVRFSQLDVRGVSQMPAFFESINDEHGRIDVLVNNAGILDNSTVETLDEQTWDDVIDTNLKGYFFTCQACIPYLEHAENPRIVNISSNAGRMGGFENGLAYTASKGGINALTYGLARRLAPYGITVNAVAPGTIVSDMSNNYSEEQKSKLLERFPIGRMGNADEVAEAVLYFASINAGFTTGAILDVNGGLFMG